ncbi:MAG: hypothetical protein WBC91_10895 [Phototrophicaceae bacterium]
MFYIKRKNYAGRWLVKIVQAALIFGIVFYGLDFFGQMLESQYGDEIIFESSQQEVQVIRVHPMNMDAQIQYSELDYFSFGLQHQMSDQHYDAIADYTRSIELNANFASSYLNRGVAYEQLGNNEYNAMLDFNAWMTRDYMTVLTHEPIDASTDLMARMSESYRFDVPLELNKGDVINLSAVSVDADLVDPIIVLLDGNGNPVAANDDVRRDNGSLVTMNAYIDQYEVTRSGDYTLMVTHAGGGSYGDVTIRIDIDN